MENYKKTIEAALFMTQKPLQLHEIAKISGVQSLGFLKETLEELKKDYEGRGVEIVQTPQGWKMDVRQDILPQVSHLTPYAEIPEGAKRTLALIVYKEPARQSEIVKMQGNKAYSYVHQLEKAGLIKSEKAGRTKLLKITQEFERYFGEEKEKIQAEIRSSLQAKA